MNEILSTMLIYKSRITIRIDQTNIPITDKIVSFWFLSKHPSSSHKDVVNAGSSLEQLLPWADLTLWVHFLKGWNLKL